MESTPSIDYESYPALFQAADAASSRGQRTYLRAVRARLILSVLAAASAAVTLRVGAADIAAVSTALLFVSALATGMFILHNRPDKAWYAGRALAESVKTLTWRYTVGGAPFPRSLTATEANRRFIDRLDALRAEIAAVHILPSAGSMISDRMRELRSAPLKERRKIYLFGRIHDQQVWYSGKAQYHRRRSGVYQVVMLCLEVVGIGGALVKAFGFVSFDLAGIIAACIAAFAAWTATRQHATTANAYIVASHELGAIWERLREDTDENSWAGAVADAEAAISREHSTWRASHGE
ncbi:DUF4231 domain-containing protein [Saccharopolyspora cebuensis]|uniref:DUF4231 domain-containing protein n=1 Tax=Saccharopolyspora cebuensis TaxID=418759 RepID=A0ABV4CDW3_9PSEU